MRHLEVTSSGFSKTPIPFTIVCTQQRNLISRENGKDCRTLINFHSIYKGAFVGGFFGFTLTSPLALRSCEDTEITF